MRHLWGVAQAGPGQTRLSQELLVSRYQSKERQGSQAGSQPKKILIASPWQERDDRTKRGRVWLKVTSRPRAGRLE